jgi:hypothetical protein
LKLVEQGFDAGATPLALAMNQAQARQEQGDMFGGRIDYAGGHRQRRRLECGNDFFRAEAPNAVRMQQALDTLRSQAPRNAGRWRKLEQRPGLDPLS